MKAFIKNVLLAGLLGGSLLAACNDIFETDISGGELIILAPADSLVIKGNEANFFWEELAGAEAYRLQVARPSFAEAKAIVLDTLVVGNSFAYTFDAAWHEWRLRAENSVYASEYQYARFQVDTSSNIEDYKVVLLEPKPQHETQSNALLFSWEPLELADYYVFQLAGTDTTIFEQLEATSIGVNLLVNDGIFEWKVLAVNEETGKNAVSDERSLRIDNTAPEVPELLLPGDKAIFTTQQLVEFEWEAVVDTDQDFKEFVLRVFREDEPDNPILEHKLTTTKAGFFGGDDPLPVGAYLWEIKTVDRLGNTSEAGFRTRSFSVQ